MLTDSIFTYSRAMKAATWALDAPAVGKPRKPEQLGGAQPALVRLVEAFGSTAVARLVDVRPATVTNWRRGRRTMEGGYARRVLDLRYILGRAFQTFAPETAMRWLTSNDPFLDDQRPVDVLVLQGPARLIAALDAHEAAAYS